VPASRTPTTPPDAVADALAGVRRLPAFKPDIVAIGLVGSWARGDGRTDSDVDVVVLTTSPQSLLETDDWYSLIHPKAVLVRAEDFGAVQERRLRLPDGLEVEVGVGAPSWAETASVDPGTRRVVADGLSIIHDPGGLLARLRAACRAGE
jgi:uncharacterized protein